MATQKVVEAELETTLKQMKSVVVDATLHMRAEPMEEFKVGKHSESDPDYEIGFWKEREAELAVNGEEDEAAGEPSTPRVESSKTTENVQVEGVFKPGTQDQGSAKEVVVEHEGVAQE